MLKIENGRRNGGFILWGDYTTLKNLHSFLMDVSERSSILDSEGLLPSLAYDLRKAFEGYREKDTVQISDDEVSLYGVEQVWPLFISQVALARSSLAFISSTKHEQAQMYALEAFLEDAIEHAFPAESGLVRKIYTSLCSIQENEVTDIIGSRVAFFLDQTPQQRRMLLPEVLQSLEFTWICLQERLGMDRTSAKIDVNKINQYSWESIDDMTAEQRSL